MTASPAADIAGPMPRLRRPWRPAINQERDRTALPADGTSCS
jgi:hypothetical protein